METTSFNRKLPFKENRYNTFALDRMAQEGLLFGASKITNLFELSPTMAFENSIDACR